MIVGYLISGVIEALVLVAVAYLLSRFTKDIVGRSLLAAFLVVAAAVYIVFAVRAGEGAYWVVGEAVGVGIYGTMALRGLRYSPLWLAAGWAFHPVWDVALHYFGPGGSFAPASHTTPCLTLHPLVAPSLVLPHAPRPP